MKKITLMTVMLLIIALGYGQKIRKDSSIKPYAEEEKRIETISQPSLKTEGEIFFKETFNWKDPSNPQGWSLPAGWQIVDVTGFGTPWVWRAGTDSIRGRFSFEKGHKYSLSPDDGFIVIPMDEYNYQDGVITDNYGTSWIQLPPVDCSAHPTVVVKFQQYFRCNVNVDVKMWVSNDQGVHWSIYDMSYGTIINIFCKKPKVEVNISDVAAGMPNIWIRFVWTEMRYYFWAIDDLTLSEAFNNEMQLEKPWLYMTDLEKDDDEGFVYMIPFSQVGTDNFGGYTFRAGFLNGGRDDQEDCLLNAEVFKNGISVYNQNSTKVTDIWALQRDTFEITTPFVPDGYGNFEMVLTAKQDLPDGIPSNNIYHDTYYITDSIYSNSDWDWETYSSTAGFSNSDGDCLGVLYDIKKNCEANSISVLIQQRPENKIASTKPGMAFQYWIFKWDVNESLWYPAISSEYTEVTESMLNTWVTLPLVKDGESEFLQGGEQYIAALQQYHMGGISPNNNQYRFTIGSDRSHEYAPGKTVYCNYDNLGTWYQNRDLSMIRLNLNNTGAPELVDVHFNVDMTLPIANGYFNPAGGDFVDVAGTFNNWAGSAHMDDPEGDGIYRLTVPAFETFRKIEYKYRINGNWNTSEFPAGGPNRVYRVTYFNLIGDVYNNGISMGVNNSALSSSVNVFPNPTSGVFTLNVANAVTGDLDISVTNLQGQTVYRKLVKSILNYQETIDLTDYAKGLYILKVNNRMLKLVIE
jgi:hypothetical protein